MGCRMREKLMLTIRFQGCLTVRLDLLFTEVGTLRAEKVQSGTVRNLVLTNLISATYLIIPSSVK